MSTRQAYFAGRGAVVLALLMVPVFLAGCATPDARGLSRTEILHPDEDDNIGGTFLESGDIRTIATKMTVALLSTPEVSARGAAVRITTAPIRNSTRFIVDKSIFMKRLRIELNRVSEGRIRFFSQGVGQSTRRQILQEQDEELWSRVISEVADHVARSPVVTSAKEPPTIAVIPVRNTNIVGLNADSFTALIRAKIAEKAAGKVLFLAREKNGKVIEEILDEEDIKNLGMVKTKGLKDLYGVDYFLGGEFIAQSLKKEVATGKGTSPNVTKHLNVVLIDAETGAVPVEKLVKVERKMKSGVGRSDYLLTGELSALSKAAAGGVRSDYIIISFQLVDPVSNEILWEDAYETKKKTRTSTLYR